MIQKKFIVGLLFVVALVASSINVMSSQTDRVAFRRELIKANSSLSIMSDEQLRAAQQELTRLANKIRTTNVSSISRNAGISYSDLMNRLNTRIASLAQRRDSSTVTEGPRDTRLAPVDASQEPVNPKSTRTIETQTDAKIETQADAEPIAQDSGTMTPKKLKILIEDLKTDSSKLVQEIRNGTLSEESVLTALDAMRFDKPAESVDGDEAIYKFLFDMRKSYNSFFNESATDYPDSPEAGALKNIAIKIVATVNRLLSPFNQTYKFQKDSKYLNTVNYILNDDLKLFTLQFGMQGEPKDTVTEANYLELLTKTYADDADLAAAGYKTEDFVNVIQGAKLPIDDVAELTTLVQRMYDIYIRHESLQGNVKARIAFVMGMDVVKGFKYAEKQRTDLNKQLEAMKLEPISAEDTPAVTPPVSPAPPVTPPAPTWTLETATNEITDISKIKKANKLDATQINNLNSIYKYLVSAKDVANSKWVKAAKELNSVLAVRRKTKELADTLVSIEIK